MANSRSASVPGVDLGSIAMALEMDWGRGKDFRACPHQDPARASRNHIPSTTAPITW
jgi:hypothetical protein